MPNTHKKTKESAAKKVTSGPKKSSQNLWVLGLVVVLVVIGAYFAFQARGDSSQQGGSDGNGSSSSSSSSQDNPSSGQFWKPSDRKIRDEFSAQRELEAALQ